MPTSPEITIDRLRAKVQQGLQLLVRTHGVLLKNIPENVKRAYCQATQSTREISCSEPTLSKINNNKEVGEQTLHDISIGLDYWLEHSYGYQYDSLTDLYVSKQEQGRLLEEHSSGLSGTFALIAGFYEMYHLSSYQNHILKTILLLKPNGEVVIKGINNYLYRGQAHNFESQMVAINISEVNGKPFFYQILFNIGAYLSVGATMLKHIYAIATTVSMHNEPMATRRILIRAGDLTRSLSEYSSASFAPESKEYKELEKQLPYVVHFLQDNSLMRLPYKVNEVMIMREL